MPQISRPLKEHLASLPAEQLYQRAVAILYQLREAQHDQARQMLLQNREDSDSPSDEMDWLHHADFDRTAFGRDEEREWQSYESLSDAHVRTLPQPVVITYEAFAKLVLTFEEAQAAFKEALEPLTSFFGEDATVESVSDMLVAHERVVAAIGVEGLDAELQHEQASLKMVDRQTASYYTAADGGFDEDRWLEDVAVAMRVRQAEKHNPQGFSLLVLRLKGFRHAYANIVDAQTLLGEAMPEHRVSPCTQAGKRSDFAIDRDQLQGSSDPGDQHRPQ